MFLASKDALALFDIIEYTHGLIVANSAEVVPSGRWAPHGEEVGVGGRGPPEEESGRGCGLHDHGDGPDVGHGAHPVRSPLQLEQVPNAPDDNFFLPKGLQVTPEPKLSASARNVESAAPVTLRGCSSPNFETAMSGLGDSATSVSTSM